NKNAALPDWRLKMQNAVRQRMENPAGEENAPKETQYQTRLVTSGANALKAEIVEETAEPLKNEKVANALKRIEQSRKAFFVEESQPELTIADDSNQNKNYPFYIAARTAENDVKPPESKASVNVPPKPKLVASAPRNADGELDTNKLPPLPTTAIGFDKVSTDTHDEIAQPKTNDTIGQVMLSETAVKENIVETAEAEESDDLAPFAMRFNAGLFDLIIGSFASFILLAPFMLAGGEWMTFTGLLAFAATLSVVMFIYLTTAVGMFGRSIGMRLFSLELVDVEENEYPTFHQAAVSSSVYLLSLVFGGIGFLTIPFNEEKRAVHDIVSGTIVVKEY
ncbi:MAG TPA: RDD family protein, partial [Pyrinomonadaceae bacterium]